jgi:pimeloyl-ACP methyl ester carboxylesterase
VLFIHGYSPGIFGVGGGKGTWKDFPRLLKKLGYVPFEFRWSTSARFQDVARDLGYVIKYLTRKTDMQLHIVAHSFGGVLTRTLLQGVKLNGAYSDIGKRIASVTTLGSPHSGILDKSCRFDRRLPLGQDTQRNVDFFELCGQLSCQQAGEPVFGKFAAAF